MADSPLPKPTSMPLKADEPVSPPPSAMVNKPTSVVKSTAPSPLKSVTNVPSPTASVVSAPAKPSGGIGLGAAVAAARAAVPPPPSSQVTGGANVPSPIPSSPLIKVAGAPSNAPANPKLQENPNIKTPGSDAKRPVMAGAGGLNIKKFLPFALIGGLVLLVVVGALAFMNRGGQQTAQTNTGGGAGTQNTGTTPGKQVTLTYWGLWEEAATIQPILKEFEQQNPGVIVSYVKQSPKDYRERLQTAISTGQGPDLFRFHASWTPMLKDDLAPVPANIYSVSQFQQTFYPIAVSQLQSNGQLVGVPLTYDSLMLFYNKDMLSAASASVPKTWAELSELAGKLTVREGNTIRRGGVAMGNATNVEHFSDILGLLMLQNGANPADPSSKNAQDAMIFYTKFVKTDKVWDETLPSSTTAFARGDVAMMFAPSWRAHEIFLLNPNLKFGMAQVPQLSQKTLTWGTYWAEGVNSKGKNKDVAFKLVQFLSSAENMKKLYAAQAANRKFGEPYSRVELASSLSTDEYVAPILSMAPQAQNWYLNSYTYDNGINDLIIKYYRDAVNGVITQNDSVAKVMATVAAGTKQVLRQYGVTTGTTTP